MLMPIELRWDNDDKTVIRLVATDSWNWNDFYKTMRQAATWFYAVLHPVELVIDLRGTTKMPAGALGHIRSLGKRIAPPGHDRVLLIGLESGLVQTLGGADGRYSADDRLIRFVQTEDEAQAVLAEWLAKSED
jgi:hypothetical protein